MRGIIKGSNLMLILGLFTLTSLMAVSQNSSAASPSIIMTTDKSVYAQGESIRLELTNSLNTPIWFIDYHQPDLVFWGLETVRGGNWLSIGLRLPLIEEGKPICKILMYERPIGEAKALKEKSNHFFEWDQKVCLPKVVTESTEPELIKKGKYRFVLRYSMDTVKSEDIESEPWKRAVELGDKKLIYSNEFVVK